MRSVSSREWMFLAIILIYSFVPTFGGLFRIAELLGGPAITPANPRALAHPLPIVLHILSSFLFCLLGALHRHTGAAGKGTAGGHAFRG